MGALVGPAGASGVWSGQDAELDEWRHESDLVDHDDLGTDGEGGSTGESFGDALLIVGVGGFEERVKGAYGCRTGDPIRCNDARIADLGGWAT